ncbi:MAG: asparaginase [Acidobacteria bacterium]|nr:asparaginase [Acidobacteriota bacterium]
MSPARGYVPLVEVRRGGTVESVHFGAIAVVDSGGRTIASAGDPATPVVLRSTAKPAQVLPLLDSGAADRFGFSEEEIAVMIGSHGGEPFHVEAVRSILEKARLQETALLCGAHAPNHKPSAQALRRLGREPSALHNNCSGKHAGMLALAVHLGAPLAAYLDPEHPVQVRIRSRLEALAGLGPGTAGLAIDGCSAPTFIMPLGSLALLYARLPAGEGDAGAPGAARRAVAAMRRHPEMIAGSDRLCTELMRRGRGGLIAKIGAEGMYGMAFERDGRSLGIALKIADGDGQRARFGAALEALHQLGALTAGDQAALRERFVGEVRNHRGLLVGTIAATFDLARGML